MPRLDARTEQPAHGSDLRAIISRLSAEMLALAPGPLAELRRMEPGGAGSAAYWRLASRCGFLHADAERWLRIVKIMAILTPKGERQPSDRLHDPDRPLGAVLCDGGDPAWQPPHRDNPDGVLPEKRLARFLALPPRGDRPLKERLDSVLP